PASFLARPKSLILGWPSPPSSTLAGLRSRCTNQAIGGDGSRGTGGNGYGRPLFNGGTDFFGAPPAAFLPTLHIRQSVIQFNTAKGGAGAPGFNGGGRWGGGGF